MTRAELWGSLAGITPVESTLLSAYENEEEQIWREGLGDSPHGHKWSTSFHSSAFPGDDPSVCGRAQVYKLMDPPPEKPLDPETRALFDEGLMIEHMFVKRWSNYGVLLSADVTGDDEYQTGFEDSETWLTGSPDAILLHPFHTKSEVVDVKSTSHEKVMAMREDPKNTIYSHKKYVRQLQAYISEANKKFSPTVIVCSKSGLLIKNGKDKCSAMHKGQCVPKILKVEPPDSGTLFYSSREKPLLTASYYITKDDNVFESGRNRVKSWKDQFIEGILPNHVREGESAKWSEGECKYCLGPETKILTSNLTWIKAIEAKVGQEIIGFDEDFGKGNNRSRYRKSIIENYSVFKKLRVLVKTDKGHTIVSCDHKFLVRRSSQRQWVEASRLKEGDKIIYLSDPWDTLETYDSGYLSGIFDGEGNLAKNYVCFAQKEGVVLDKVTNLLSKLGFTFTIEGVSGKKDGCKRVRINGGLSEQLKFIGSIRPDRLLNKSQSLWDGVGTWSSKSNHATVEDVSLQGSGLVVSIETSTKTLISDGMLSHNCDFKKSFCKLDYKNKVKNLKDSELINFSKKIRSSYDYDTARKQVFDRWGVKDPIKEKELV